MDPMHHQEEGGHEEDGEKDGGDQGSGVAKDHPEFDVSEGEDALDGGSHGEGFRGVMSFTKMSSR
jgi:hypothetical protein